MGNDERVRATGRAFHLTPECVWRAQEHGTRFAPEAYAGEGFVHCTSEEPLLMDVANRYYRGDGRPYLVLEIDLTQTRAAAVYEDSACCYPHVYGPIEINAVAQVRRVLRDADGTFTAVGERIDRTTT